MAFNRVLPLLFYTGVSLLKVCASYNLVGNHNFSKLHFSLHFSGIVQVVILRGVSLCVLNVYAARLVDWSCLQCCLWLNFPLILPSIPNSISCAFMFFLSLFCFIHVHITG